MSEPNEDPNSGEAPTGEALLPDALARQTRPTLRLPDVAKRLLATNPFYPISAALLLYGFYKVSADPRFLPGEISQLIFNFSSLQVYEVLLVLTAIFLARRRIWYDSTLLVGLENMLVLVAFILVSQAALIDRRIIWVMCLAGGILAMLRFSALKRFIAELNLPEQLLYSGLA